MRTSITKTVKTCALVIGTCLASAGSAWAAFSHPGCTDLAPADFKAVKLVARTDGIAEPLKMALDGDPSGNIDIYWAERQGDVKRYSTASKTVTKIATVNVDSKFESGLTGIALDPGFKTNNWIYLFYSFGNVNKYSYRVSRFTLNRTSNTLDLPGEKIVLEFTAGYNKMHTGGAMLFDAAGDLWITTGENGAGVAGAANTNDLRGKILRIRPTADGGYTTPAGNLFPPGTPKTRPEIYVMGTRNPYTLALDPVRKAIAWGDVGPDQGKDTEEFDFTTVPGNFGWPQFSGNNVPGEGNTDPKAPVVVNSGVSPLPPAIPAIYNYKQSASMTGPVYYFDPALKSTIKLPPHLNGVWFVTDFSQNWIEGVNLDAAGKTITKKERIFTDLWGKTIRLAIDMAIGPDGALYVIGYSSGAWFGSDAGTSIFRVEYTGNCVGPVGIRTAGAAPKAPGIAFGNRSIAVTGEGPHAIEIRDPSGRMTGILRGEGAATHSLRGVADKGVHFLTVRTRTGAFHKTVVLE